MVPVLVREQSARRSAGLRTSAATNNMAHQAARRERPLTSGTAGAAQAMRRGISASARMPGLCPGHRENTSLQARRARRPRIVDRLCETAGLTVGRLNMLADVFPHLVVPIGPFVAAFRAPVVQMMRNAGVPEDFGHFVGGAGLLPRAAAGGEMDVAAGELLAKPGIILVRHVVDRVIEVEVVVVHSVHGIAQIVNAGESVAALHAVGVFEESVGGVIGAERGAVGGYRDGALALVVDERDDFAGHVVVILRLEPAAMERVRVL